MERRTSCLQSNVDFLQKTITKLAADHQQKIDAANRQIEALKSALAGLQKVVDDLQSRAEEDGGGCEEGRATGKGCDAGRKGRRQVGLREARIREAGIRRRREIRASRRHDDAVLLHDLPMSGS